MREDAARRFALPGWIGPGYGLPGAGAGPTPTLRQKDRQCGGRHAFDTLGLAERRGPNEAELIGEFTRQARQGPIVEIDGQSHSIVRASTRYIGILAIEIYRIFCIGFGRSP